MFNSISKLESLHRGFVLERLENKNRSRITIPVTEKKCIECNKSLLQKKCIKLEQGNVCLYLSCFKCYLKSLDKS